MNIQIFYLIVSVFLKYKFIYFNWRLITLQYCIGFAIHQLEPIIQSEVSQKEKHQYSILTHIYRI